MRILKMFCVLGLACLAAGALGAAEMARPTPRLAPASAPAFSFEEPLDYTPASSGWLQERPTTDVQTPLICDEQGNCTRGCGFGGGRCGPGQSCCMNCATGQMQCGFGFCVIC